MVKPLKVSAKSFSIKKVKPPTSTFLSPSFSSSRAKPKDGPPQP